MVRSTSRGVAMLLRSSGFLYERLYLIALGATCRYAVVAEDGSITLSDPGCSAHVGALSDRFKRLALPLERVSRVIITHLDADRIGGLGLLRQKLPSLQVCGSAAMQATLKKPEVARALWEEDKRISEQFPAVAPQASVSFEEFQKSLTIDRVLTESDALQVDEDITIRCVATPGHRNHSMAYVVVPHEFAIVDETFGYYHGRGLSAPGGDMDLQAAVASVKKFTNLNLSGIGFSYTGAITGALVKKHLEALIQNTEDIIVESKKALGNGVSREEVDQQIKAWFYTSTQRDPCLQESLEHTFKSILAQIHS